MKLEELESTEIAEDVREERLGSSLRVVPSATPGAEAEQERVLSKLGIYTARTLADVAKTIGKQPYLVDGLLRARSVNVLVGDSGLGKTPLGIQLGLCVATGQRFLGRESRRGPVLYCDAESDLTGFLETLHSISAFLGLSEPADDFHVWSPNWEPDTARRQGQLDSWASRLLDHVKRVRPALVIVDPLRMFWSAAELKNDDVVAMIKDLRTTNKGSDCCWLVTHHRRKVNQQAGPVGLEGNPQGWFQEAAGAHALINQTDTRIGVVPRDGQADLLMAGFVRGTGPFVPLDLQRVANDEGSPMGYRLLLGSAHLNPEDRGLFDRLPCRFRFKDVLAAMGGTSDSNASRFLKKCDSLGLVKKESKEYVKSQPESVESMESVESRPLETPTTPSAPVVNQGGQVDFGAERGME